MKRQDVARVAKMAPSLKELILLSIPEALLVEHWARSPTDAESMAALLGAIVNAARQATDAADGPDGTTELVSIETAGSLIIVAPVSPEGAAGFVFERSTALGMARIQIRDILLELEPLMRVHPVAAKPAAAVPMPVAAAPGPLDHDLEVEPPALQPGPRPERRRASVAPLRAPAPEVVEPERPRAVRLLEFLHRYAPDPHVSLLRLSLRTGIALEKLDRPELLTEEQVESMAESVRDIIGQEQLGI